MASDVPNQNWAPYRQLLEQSRKVLDEHASVAQQDPEWDALRIAIARQQGAESDAILAMADRALARSPYYYPIHNSAVNALLPRWGGSRQAIQAYVQMALKHSSAGEGQQAYARIYYYIARTAARDPLDDLNVMGAKWPPMHQGLQEILKAYPSSFNRDVARWMACESGDGPALRALGRFDTGDILSVAWWDTRDYRRQCMAWAFDGQHSRRPETLMYHARMYLSFLEGFGPEFWQPLRWIALIVFLAIHGAFALFDKLARRDAPGWSVSGAARSFNRLNYPRSYHISPALKL
jgi:hypothetical protein